LMKGIVSTTPMPDICPLVPELCGANISYRH
jgi:hypothetical protein